MSQMVKAVITGRAEPAPGICLLEFAAPEIAGMAMPGQFVHVRCGEGSDPLLRRPISIHAVDRRTGVVRIMFQVVGRGTALLAGRRDGLLDVMGPLGRGFSMPGGADSGCWPGFDQGSINHQGKPGDQARLNLKDSQSLQDSHNLQGNQGHQNNHNIQDNSGYQGNSEHGVNHLGRADGVTDLLELVVVGGGIGAAPLNFLLQELAHCGRQVRVRVMLGARCAEQLLIDDVAVGLGFDVSVATDDGSRGYHGLVTDLLAKELEQDTQFVYACGPEPMLKAVSAMLVARGVPGEISVEERMACGVGACLVCACRTRDNAGQETYRRACVDGPVFRAGEVVWS